MRRTVSILSVAMLAAGVAIAQVAANPNQSPAALPRPKPARIETYAAAQVESGELRFISQCGFCHGRDAAGGDSGPDLTRSDLVAADTRGDRIVPLLREGRPDAGMPSFHLDDEELQAIAAFIHTQANKFATLAGGRRTVEPEDLATGNAQDGRVYFNGAGGCSGCHSVTGDLAGVATRYQGLTLLRRMLSPSGQPAPAPPTAIFTLASGLTVSAPLVGEDEFSVTVLDPLGVCQTYAKDAVRVKIEDPMSAHFAQLGKYTAAAMHNIYAYLETLR